jgi:hypothetical protein
MPTALLLALALSLQAAEYAPDYNDPGFWKKSYSFSDKGQHLRGCLFMERGRKQELFDRLYRLGATEVPIPRLDSNGKVTAWDFPGAKVEDLRRMLSELGLYQSISMTVNTEEFPEIAYKRRHLSAEAARLPVELRGIRGLMSAQMETLGQLSKAMENAHKKGRLELYLLPPPMPHADGQACARVQSIVNFDREMPGSNPTVTDVMKVVSPVHPDYWKRTVLDVSCGGPVWIMARVAINRSSMEALSEKVRAYQRRQRKAPEVCGKDVSFTMPAEPREEAELRRLLTAFGELVHWSRKEAGTEVQGLAQGARKHEQLSRELEEGGQALAEAPHVKALVAAEIARLQPAADGYKSLEGLALVTVQMEVREDR